MFRAELLLTETRREGTQPRFLGGLRAQVRPLRSGRVNARPCRPAPASTHARPPPPLALRAQAAALGGRSMAADASTPICMPAPFETEVMLHSDMWHFVLLSLRRGTLLSKDEAAISVDGAPAVFAPTFRYPGFSASAVRGASSGVCATPAGGRQGGGLRGLLGPFACFSTATPPQEVATIYARALAGRPFFELPGLAAGWHPRLTDAGGTCVAQTAEGAWLARRRSDLISLVDTVSAKDSLGGMLNVLLPLVAARRRGLPRGAELLATSLRLVANALRDHARNQQEMLRSEGLLHLGHLLRSAHPSHFSPAAVDALIGLSEACRATPALHRQLMEAVLLRFDVWRRLSDEVRSAHLALLQGLAAQDDSGAVAVGLPQRLLDAAKPDEITAVASCVGIPAAAVLPDARAAPPLEAGLEASEAGVVGGAALVLSASSSLHDQHLHAASMLSSEALAVSGALPLLSHVVSNTCDGAAQAEALRLLAALALMHGAPVIAALQHRSGLLALVHILLEPPRWARLPHAYALKPIAPHRSAAHPPHVLAQISRAPPPPPTPLPRPSTPPRRPSSRACTPTPASASRRLSSARARCALP